jgi:hypothetical protein
MAYLRVATALVEGKSVASRSATSTSSWHSCSRSNRPAHSKLPTIQEEVNQPWANTVQGADLRANLDKNRRSRDARGYIDVTPDFPKETKCIPICMPGSSFMHIVTYK